MTIDQSEAVWKAIEAAWRQDETTLQSAILDLLETLSPIDSVRFQNSIRGNWRRAAEARKMAEAMS